MEPTDRPEFPDEAPEDDVPAEGAPEPTDITASKAAAPADITQDERMWAMLAYALKIFAPILAPFAIYVAYKRSRFVVFHALQSLYFDLAWIVFAAVALALAFALDVVPFAGWFMGRQLIVAAYLGGVADLVLTIVGAVRAYNDEWWRPALIGNCCQPEAEA